MNTKLLATGSQVDPNRRAEHLKIICPDCKEPSALTSDLLACKPCGRVFRSVLPILDFVNSPDDNEERAFYDAAYKKAKTTVFGKKAVTCVSEKWHHPGSPENLIVLTHLGDLSGKTILLLGNGESVKELIFLTMNPAHLIYSDLSPHALANIYKGFDLERYKNQLTFVAIDAHAIPFSEETFDVVYAFAMVHHLSDLDQFFGSVLKVLKPGGRAIFMDDAYAPLWHYSKQTWLKPLMKHSHKTTGISPEDYRFSMTGGFKEGVLSEKIRLAGGNPWFVRTSFLIYLFYRAAEKLLPRQLNGMLRNQRISGAVTAIDKALCKLSLFKRNQIRLIWGITKTPSDQVDTSASS